MKLKQAAIALGSFVVACGIYANTIERHWLSVTRHNITVKNLPEGWNGVRVVHLTDLHLGSLGAPYETLKRAIAIAAALQPDIFVLTGDYSDDGRPQPLDLLTPLVHTAPTIAVLGNHDYFNGAFGANAITMALQQIGITVLRNTVVPLTVRDAEAMIVGFDNAASSHGVDVAGVITELRGKKPCIALIHEPDVVEDFPSDWAGLTLAGHTHGAQVRLSPLQQIDWVTFHRGDKQTRYPRGWFCVNGNPLYVNRGLGVAGYPIRFAARPEIACFTLRKNSIPSTVF